MRSVNPYTDSVYDSPPSLANSGPSPRAGDSIPKRTTSTRQRSISSATLSGTTGSPPPHQQVPLIRAKLAPQPPPLQARDPNQHVLSLTPTTTRSTIKTAANMPLNGEKPRQPQLSAAAAKATNRTPLTPKVAVMGPPAGTPSGRRSTTTFATVHTPYKEDMAGSTASYFGNNVTPRSGSRQTRVESANTTPNGTPNTDRMSDGWDTNGRGLGMSPLALSESLGSRLSLGDSPGESRNDSNKFFYASDARPVHQSVPPRPASTHPKNSMPTFFYASDASAPSKRTTNTPVNPSSSTPVLGTTQEGIATKFFYANGTPDVDPRLSIQSSGSGSSSSNSSKVTRPSTGNSTAGLGTPPMFSRPASPAKALSQPPPQPPLRGSAMSPTSPNRVPVYSPPMLAPTTTPASKRRVSIDAPARAKMGHARTGSVPTMESLTVPKFVMPPTNPSELNSPPMSPGQSQPVITMASILQFADELEEEEEEEEGDDDDDDDSDQDEDSESESHSRRKSSQTSNPVNELVASARRERKVQDLQITNASLEAINRTLERQLRKQTAELRRYRRLSRAGLLASASAAPSRVNSIALTEPPGDLHDPTKEKDEHEEEEEEEEEGEEEEEEDSTEDGESSGEEATADPQSQPADSETLGSKRRKRDERRLQLDLTKHQELLLDSQKMNQSLKRCLNWTEELIKEGQKALAYHVKVSDVDALPGRVLAPSYYDYGDDTSHLGDDLSHIGDDTISNIETVSNLESELEPWIKGAQDRDSGVELPVDDG